MRHVRLRLEVMRATCGDIGQVVGKLTDLSPVVGLANTNAGTTFTVN